jgi:hypothetical protein
MKYKIYTKKVTDSNYLIIDLIPDNAFLSAYLIEIGTTGDVEIIRWFLDGFEKINSGLANHEVRGGEYYEASIGSGETLLYTNMFNKDDPEYKEIIINTKILYKLMKIWVSILQEFLSNREASIFIEGEV